MSSDIDTFGFLRARALVQELGVLIPSRPREITTDDRLSTMRGLVLQIRELCHHREPVPTMCAKLDEAITAEVAGEGTAERSMQQAFGMVLLAVETARVGVENGYPEDYWHRPFEYDPALQHPALPPGTPPRPVIPLRPSS